jgi:hypothetical protein
MVIGRDVFPYREERLAIIRLFIELSCELRGFIFAKGDKDRDDTSVLVACAVFIGELEGRPMNATKVAHFIGVPRTTVLRKLEHLMGIGAVTKKDRKYVYAPRARPFSQCRLERYSQIIFRAWSQLQRVS